jgi:hypothetical protein
MSVDPSYAGSRGLMLLVLGTNAKPFEKYLKDKKT